jgi:hypothetical protein
MEKSKEAAQWKRLAKAFEAEVEEGKLQLQRRLMEKSKEAAQWKRQAKAPVAVAEPGVDESQVLLQRCLMEKSKEAAQWKRQAKALKSELEVEIQRPDAPSPCNAPCLPTRTRMRNSGTTLVRRPHFTRTSSTMRIVATMRAPQFWIIRLSCKVRGSSKLMGGKPPSPSSGRRSKSPTLPIYSLSGRFTINTKPRSCGSNKQVPIEIARLPVGLLPRATSVKIAENQSKRPDNRATIVAPSSSQWTAGCTNENETVQQCCDDMQ